jgi:outer membrane protein assembly factor BamB
VIRTATIGHGAVGPFGGGARPVTRLLAAAACLLPLLAGCGNSGDGNDTAGQPAAPTASPHGYVAGAEETAEQQSRLVVADPGTGEVRVLDLITEEITDTGAAGDGTVRAIGTDGRFAYLTTGTGALHIVDSGAWLVDHGDHVHYYRAAIRSVGLHDGAEPLSIHGDTAVTAVTHADGTVSLFDRAALEEGTVAEPRTIETGAGSGTAVPYAGHLIVGGTEVLTRNGQRVATLDTSCPDPRGEAVTSHGVVFGCADGALLVSEDEGTFTGEKIPYPEGASPRAVDFTQRPGSGTLAALAGERGVWTLDVATEEWTLTRTGPMTAVAANAVGDGATLLVLTRDGVLHAFDTTTGEETARKELPHTGEGSVIELDTSRAYVNSPFHGVVYEIDYADELRIARTLTLDITPSLMVETGR